MDSHILISVGTLLLGLVSALSLRRRVWSSLGGKNLKMKPLNLSETSQEVPWLGRSRGANFRGIAYQDVVPRRELQYS